MLSTQDIQVRGLYRHSTIEQTEDGIIYPSVPERIGWGLRDDTTLYRTAGQEYLFDIVAAHYKEHYNQPWFIVEIVAQFQPLPIIDPSVPLPPHFELHLPSVEFIETVAYSDTYVGLPEM